MQWWKLISLSGGALACLLTFAVPASAQMYGDSVERRLERQADQLERGIRSGALTPQEARKLTREQERLERQADRIQADGRITPQEHHRLDHKIDQADRRLERELHDRQVTYPRYGVLSPDKPRWHNKEKRRHYGPESHYRHRPRPQVLLQKHKPWLREPRLARQYW